MKIEIWFDFVCPFCYLGETKFQKALDAFEGKNDVKLIFRSFQLQMASEQTKGKDIHQVVAEKYNISYAKAKANNERITEAGKAVGLNYNFDIVKLNDSDLAHQIVQFAKRFHKEQVLITRYFKAFFEDGLDIGNRGALIQIASEVELDIPLLNQELAGNSLKKAVLSDEATARQLGITSIPHFIIDGKYSISGAQDSQYFLTALEKAYSNRFKK